ncbi:hypothetical protein FRB90_011609 [Tulasnella sp. 427]|nr:hypothetical protein FRB90_011609 [Tulasnella sp. 427]
MVHSTSKISLPEATATPGAGPSKATKSAPPATTPNQVFVHPDGEPVHFFLQPDLPAELVTNFENAIASRGGRRVVSSPPERGGFIVVDPRTPTGMKFVKGDKRESKWRVVPYTFLRACIFKAEVLQPDEFKDVKPVFEQGTAALRIHIHPSLEAEIPENELEDFKFFITKHGGNTGATKRKADVIITSDEGVAEVRNQHSHSNTHVETVSWVESAIKKGKFKFTEGLSAEEIEVLQAKPPHAQVQRYEFAAAEDRELVAFLAEFYPAKGDPGRAFFRGYRYLCENLDRYPWAQKHSESSWQHHYVREKARFDDAIERYLDAHPELRRTEEDAEDHRLAVLGPVRRKPGPPKKIARKDRDEDERITKRLKRLSPKKKKKQDELASDDEVQLVESDGDYSPAPERKSKTAAKDGIKRTANAELEVIRAAQIEHPQSDDEEVDQLDEEDAEIAADPEADEPEDEQYEPNQDQDMDEPAEEDEVDELVDDFEDDPPQEVPAQESMGVEIDLPETTDSFPPIRVAPPERDEEDEEMPDEDVEPAVKAPVGKGKAKGKGKGKEAPAPKDVFAKAVRRTTRAQSKGAGK